jgi:hydrazine synthase alpha subunit-like protein
MKLRATAFQASVCVAMFFPLCGFGPDRAAGVGADFIVTSAPVYEPLAALRGKERFPRGAQLLLVHDGKTEPLVAGFAVTADANVSFDGKSVLFAGKKNASDPWQVWEVELSDRSMRQLTSGTTDAIRPLYLPGTHFVYTQRTPNGFQLTSASLDPTPTQPGSQRVLPLTYTNASAIPTDVLADGRILFESGFPLGSGAIPELYLVYSDGSGVESYRCDHGTPRWGGKQLASGDVVFAHGFSLARFTSPLAHEERISAPRAEFTGAIAETESQAWLISARTASEKHYAIKLWKPGAAAMRSVLAESSHDLVEPVLIAPRNRPKRHPSGLHPWDYANLLVLDARLSRDGTLKGTPASVRLETEDANGHTNTLGTAPIEQDGSYFVQVPGDRPIRFALLDAHGAVLRQEHGWFWARGGEQRICVGCHTGPERASENRVPAVLLRTTTPVDLTATHPAQAALESLGGRSK